MTDTITKNSPKFDLDDYIYFRTGYSINKTTQAVKMRVKIIRIAKEGIVYCNGYDINEKNAFANLEELKEALHKEIDNMQEPEELPRDSNKL